VGREDVLNKPTRLRTGQDPNVVALRDGTGQHRERRVPADGPSQEGASWAQYPREFADEQLRFFHVLQDPVTNHQVGAVVRQRPCSIPYETELVQDRIDGRCRIDVQPDDLTTFTAKVLQPTPVPDLVGEGTSTAPDVHDDSGVCRQRLGRSEEQYGAVNGLPVVTEKMDGPEGFFAWHLRTPLRLKTCGDEN
jgi:hypothetical protein